MSKKAFDQIKAGADEALIIAPYIAQIGQLTAELAAERERREEAEDNERGHSAEAKYWREKVAKLREALGDLLGNDRELGGRDTPRILRARAVLEETKDQSREHEVLGIGDFSQEDIASVQQAQTSVEAAAFNSELSETKKCEVNDFKSGWYLTILDICGKKYIRLPDWVSRVLDRCKGGRYE